MRFLMGESHVVQVTSDIEGGMKKTCLSLRKDAEQHFFCGLHFGSSVVFHARIHFVSSVLTRIHHVDLTDLNRFK